MECQSGKFDLTVIQDALRAERHEHTYQTQERKLRAANIIIHGLYEGTEIDDQIEIKKIFKAVGVTSLPKSFTRLGSQSTHARGRPVKLVMNNLQEKKIFMNNLPKLKTAEENIRRISITHDFTLEQRKINAAMVKKAREMTSNNNNYVWKLRGLPLGMMKLIRFNKTSNISTVNCSNNNDNNPNNHRNIKQTKSYNEGNEQQKSYESAGKHGEPTQELFIEAF